MIRNSHHQTDADNQATLEPHRQHQYKHDDDDGFDQVDDKRSQRIPHTLGADRIFYGNLLRPADGYLSTPPASLPRLCRPFTISEPLEAATKMPIERPDYRTSRYGWIFHYPFSIKGYVAADAISLSSWPWINILPMSSTVLKRSFTVTRMRLSPLS